MNAPGDPDVFLPHDHRACRRGAMAAVLAECRARGLRLTPARRCVLETLLAGHRAMTAYELLDRLRAAGLGGQPPVVYRALDFLIANGFVHRIERLSAFVACTRRHPDEARDGMEGDTGDAPEGGAAGRHEAVFLVCRACRKVAEAGLPALPGALAGEAARHAFTLERVSIEMEGLCEGCREEAP